MATSEEYNRLKKNKGVVEKMIMSDMDWFADELNTEDVAVLNDPLCNEVKNPNSTKTPEQRAALVVKHLLNRVDVYPQALAEFVAILRKKPKKFNVLINKLEPPTTAGEPPVEVIPDPARNLRRRDLQQHRDGGSPAVKHKPQDGSTLNGKAAAVCLLVILGVGAVSVSVWYLSSAPPGDQKAPPPPPPPSRPAASQKETLSSQDDTDCHLLNQKDSKKLEKYFDRVISEQGDGMKLCKYLDLKKCNSLGRKKQLDPFNLADTFIEEKPRACWEELVTLFCERFSMNKLGLEVAKENGVDDKYCTDS